MTQQIINIGSTPNDGTGDNLRSGMTKVNANFTDLYNENVTLAGSTGSNLVGFLQAGTGGVLRTVTSKLKDVGLSITDFGAVANGTAYSTSGGTDNSTAINAAIVAANALATGTVSANNLGVATVYIPDGTWNIANPIIQLPGVSLRFSKNAMFNVTAAMSWAISTPLNNLCEDIGIAGGRILCNNLCDGVYLQTIRHYYIDDTMVEDWNFAGWTFGNPSSTTNNYGVSGTPKTHRRFSAPPNGSIALWVRASTDSQIHDVELVGGQTGVTCQSGGSFMNIHPWARVGPMLIGFNFSGGGAILTNCYADSANQIGFNMTGTNYTITSPLVFNGTSSTSAPDNTMIGIKFNTVNPQSTVTGLVANALSNTNRIAQDVKTADSTFTGLTVIGTTTNNVVTVTSNAISGGNNLTLVNSALTASGLLTATGVTSSSADIIVTGAAATNRNIDFSTAGNLRWVWRANSDAETGSNAGTNLQLISRTDAGAVLRTDLQITRSNGTIVIGDSGGGSSGATHLLYGLAFSLKQIGAGLRVAEGSNAKQGVITLSSGSAVVSNTSVTANSRIMLSAQDNNTTGALRVSARTPGTSFTVTSSVGTDSGVIAYEIFEPA